MGAGDVRANLLLKGQRVRITGQRRLRPRGCEQSKADAKRAGEAPADDGQDRDDHQQLSQRQAMLAAAARVRCATRRRWCLTVLHSQFHRL